MSHNINNELIEQRFANWFKSYVSRHLYKPFHHLHVTSKVIFDNKDLNSLQLIRQGVQTSIINSLRI